MRVGNRFCILPMEGWDGTTDGEPSDLTRRRWRNFGISGAKLMWGGEAVAIRHDGRANPNQLMLTPATQASIAGLREELVSAHRERFGPNADGDLYLGLQITHSGRFARPDVWDKSAPLAACPPSHSRQTIRRRRARADRRRDRTASSTITPPPRGSRMRADISSWTRRRATGISGTRCSVPRRDPASTADRSRIACGSSRRSSGRFAAPRPASASSCACRSSIVVPHRKGADGVGVPEPTTGDEPGFGVHARRGHESRAERWARAADAPRDARREVDLHSRRAARTTTRTFTRPAFFPPLDGYEPPEDPLRGVARQIDATARLKARISESDLRRIRLQLSAGVAAERRAVQRAQRPHRFRGPRPRGVVLSGLAGGRAERETAAPRRDLPHVQRLHNRAAHGDGVGLLSARSVLRSPARSRAHPDGAGYFAGLNAARLVRSHAASRSAWQLTHAFGLSALPNRSVISASGMSSISCDRA